jgi:hypothetical protein
MKQAIEHADDVKASDRVAYKHHNKANLIRKMALEQSRSTRKTTHIDEKQRTGLEGAGNRGENNLVRRDICGLKLFFSDQRFSQVSGSLLISEMTHSHAVPNFIFATGYQNESRVAANL